jgi:hypothetical protein
MNSEHSRFERGDMDGVGGAGDRVFIFEGDFDGGVGGEEGWVPSDYKASSSANGFFSSSRRLGNGAERRNLL